MTTWDIIKIFLVLFALLGAMYLLLFVVKKYLFAFDKKKSKNLDIKILTTKGLMQKKYISIVKIHNKIYTLGISDQSITLIDKAEYNPDEFITTENQDTNIKPGFIDYFKKSLGK